MALLPNRNKNNADAKAEKKAAGDDVLMREVDEAVRKDQVENFGRTYGRPLIGLLVVGLLAFAGFLYWQSQQEAALEESSETIVAALDQVEAGNLDTGSQTVADLATNGEGAVKGAALMLQASAASEAGKTADAVKLFEQLSQAGDVPEAYRDLARLRAVASQFDDLPSAQVVERLDAMAKPGEPYFGSAGELVAMAHLDMGNTAEAGALFAQIAKDGSVPESLRGRARQMAGMLGVDAIDDIDEVIEQMSGPPSSRTGSQAAAQQAPQPQGAQ